MRSVSHPRPWGPRLFVHQGPGLLTSDGSCSPRLDTLAQASGALLLSGNVGGYPGRRDPRSSRDTRRWPAGPETKTRARRRRNRAAGCKGPAETENRDTGVGLGSPEGPGAAKRTGEHKRTHLAGTPGDRFLRERGASRTLPAFAAAPPPGRGHLHVPLQRGSRSAPPSRLADASGSDALPRPPRYGARHSALPGPGPGRSPGRGSGARGSLGGLASAPRACEFRGAACGGRDDAKEKSRWA